MNTFEPLEAYLASKNASRIAMSFAEIEAMVGRKLPNSSRKHRAWWSNNPSNSAITRAWLNAGYRTEDVDMAGERLVFRRTERAASKPVERSTAPRRHPLFGAMKGSVSLPSGGDLTEPADPDWGRQ